MQLSCGMTLGKSRSLYDPDASAYIAGVRDAGVTVDSAQSAAINRFYKDAKSGGYYSSLKRLYLPIWEVASANAIDMITGASGTFNGSVTHAAGYVQGDRSTGWFDTNVAAGSLGLSVASGSLFVLYAVLGTEDATPEAVGGAFDGVSSSMTLTSRSTRHDWNYVEDANRLVSFSGTEAGFLAASQTGSNRYIWRQTSSGFATLASDVFTPTGTVPTNTVAFLARNQGGSTAAHSDNGVGCAGVSLGLSTDHAPILSQDVIDLWEACTGLTLP